MTASTVLSTDDLTPRDRAPQWREWVYRHFGGLDSDLYGDTDFDGHMASSRAGDVILTRLEANRHRVLRTPHMARGSETGYLKIVAPWQGSASVEQHSRQAGARSGGWVIYDTTGSYAIANPEHVEHLIVMLPKEQMVERGVKLDELMARQVGAARGISRVALDTMRSTWQELPNMSEDAARGAGELIMQLVRLSLLELAGQATAVTQREALKDRILTYVARNLRDPLLSIDRIAQALNCSKRHLHNAFADGDETLASTILRLRLDACIRDLRHDAQDARAITDIALSWGFNNLSHFSRVFREHTGVSPSEYRTASQMRRAVH
ncbi:MAG: helix-turn-helix domain-containing protein [Comamonadaceae bacterium]|jgi:AraC-like DNA-binding protein|uniref:AraC-like ligand-binding domain-containing protein n=1 Tax=Candidatus Skiveiella danica TaxID=3386177 RepID=UPI003908EACE|nr:helix-turn-helix domain-containing protein [Comamonadaceae bacterium]